MQASKAKLRRGQARNTHHLTSCVCVCVRERERGRERESVCVCVCVWLREYERKKE